MRVVEARIDRWFSEQRWTKGRHKGNSLTAISVLRIPKLPTRETRHRVTRSVSSRRKFEERQVCGRIPCEGVRVLNLSTLSRCDSHRWVALITSKTSLQERTRSITSDRPILHSFFLFSHQLYIRLFLHFGIVLSTSCDICVQN